MVTFLSLLPLTGFVQFAWLMNGNNFCSERCATIKAKTKILHGGMAPICGQTAVSTVATGLPTNRQIPGNHRGLTLLGPSTPRPAFG